MEVHPWFLCMILLIVCASSAPIKTLEQLNRKGTERCLPKSILIVKEGATQSVILSNDETKSLDVSKYDSQTGQWNELFLVASGIIHSFTKMNISVSLVNQNFIVQNATKADEGLYMITSHLEGTCLAHINVTVVLGETAMAGVRSITENFGVGTVFILTASVIIYVVQNYC